MWAARGIGRRIKIRLFKTLVRPVLLYGCKTWKITKADERKLNRFQCQRLRRIKKIKWQQRMTNKRVVEIAEISEMSCEVRRRRWNWLGHVLRREGEKDCFTALGWTPEGRRARERPKTTWRRTIERERNKAGWKSWKVAKASATEQRVLEQSEKRKLVRECVGLMRLLARGDLIMMMMIIRSLRNCMGSHSFAEEKGKRS